MFRAAIFDMDGVIINSEPLHKKAYQLMFDEFNIDVSEKLYSTFTGMATLPICEKLCDIFSLKFRAETLVENKRKHFKSLFKNGLKFELIDGVLKLIKHYLKIPLIFHQIGLKLIFAFLKHPLKIFHFLRFLFHQYQLHLRLH